MRVPGILGQGITSLSIREEGGIKRALICEIGGKCGFRGIDSGGNRKNLPQRSGGMSDEIASLDLGVPVFSVYTK